MNNIKKYNGQLNVVGSKIKFYRNSKNISLVTLSNKLMLLGIDIPKNSLQRLESGKRIIKEYELVAIAKILNVSIDVLVEDFRKELEEQ
ncbi:MAG: helix-turn-helix domain-containing protein [Clostridia bacterium]